MLPVEMGIYLRRRHSQARVTQLCPHCEGGHVGDERHLVFKCPALEHVWCRHGRIYSDFRSIMRVFMWYRDQKAIASCLLQLLSEYAGLSDALLT